MRSQLAGLLMVVAVCVSCQAFAQEAPLFSPAQDFLAEAADIGIVGMKRYRAVFVDTLKLGAPSAGDCLTAAPVVLLNLFDDVVVRASLEELTSAVAGGWLWRGTVDETSGGWVTIVFGDHTITGTVVVGDSRFQIRNDGGPVHLIRELAPEDATRLATLSHALSAGSDVEMQIFHLTNLERQARGLYLYAWNDTLAGAARAHSLDMGQRAYFDHVNPDGHDPGDRITAAGYNWSSRGENIYAGYGPGGSPLPPEHVVTGWMNSPGHRKNILRAYDDPDGIYYCDLGVGHAYVAGSPYLNYYTQKFGRPQGVTTCPPVQPTQPVLSVTPSSRSVGSGSGTTTFSVANAGDGTMHWTASVTSGASWLTITSGASGTDAGTIHVAYAVNSGASSRTGTIQVTAAGSLGSPFSVTVTQAGTSEPTLSAPTLVSPADRTQVAGSRVAFRWNAVAGATRYRFQLSGTPGFSTYAEVTGTETSASWNNAPDDGSTWYWRVRAEAGYRAGPWSVTYSFVSGGSPSGMTVRSGWTLVGLSVAPRNAALGSLLVSPRPEFSYLYRWDPGARRYLAAHRGEIASLEKLRGYWLYVSRERGTYTLSVEGAPLTGAQSVVLGPRGWQMIGVPYPVAWGPADGGSMSVRRGGETRSLAGAISAGWVLNTIYAWDSAEGAWIRYRVKDGETLVPWTGYFLYTLQDGLELMFSEKPSRWATGLALGIAAEGYDPGEPPLPMLCVVDSRVGLAAVAYPSPAGAGQEVSFAVRGALAGVVEAIRVEVHDLMGRLVYRAERSGVRLLWDMLGPSGAPVASGVYLYTVQAKLDGRWVTVSVDKLLILR